MPWSAAGPGAVLFLNAPLVNPTGSIYEERELRDILEVAQKARATVVLDAVFAGLEFPGETSAWLLEQALPADAQPDLVVLAGISKELAAGGLRLRLRLHPQRGDRRLAQSLTHPPAARHLVLRRPPDAGRMPAALARQPRGAAPHAAAAAGARRAPVPTS